MVFEKLGLVGVGALLAVGVAVSTGAQEPNQSSVPSNDRVCLVSVERDQPADTFDVRRLEDENGDCRCLVNTGPSTQGRGVERQVASIWADRDCPNARPVAVADAAGGANLGNASGIVVVAPAAAAAAATGIFLAADGDQKPGRVSP